MADPFSVAGSAVGVVSLGISVCQGLISYYSAFRAQDDELDEMVGKVERLTDLLETLQHRLSSPRYRHSVSVEKVEQNVVACATALKKLDTILSRCTQEFTAEDLRHKLRAISRRMLYPFKQKTLQDLTAVVSQCQSDLETAMQILQIDQLSTVESSNAVILKNTEITRDLMESHSHEIKAIREDMQRLMEVAVPTLVLSSIRPHVQGNVGNTAATDLNVSSASLKLQASGERTIMGPESYLSLCRCHTRTKFIQRQLELGPITLIRTSKSRADHSEDCQYFVRESQDEGAGFRLQVRTRSRRWNIMAALNYNHAVGAFSINPTLVFRATVPADHPLFVVADEIVRGKRSFEAGLRSIRLLFQNGEAAPTDVNIFGNVLMTTLYDVLARLSVGIGVDKAFLERVRQLIMAFLAFGININDRAYGCHSLDLYLSSLIQLLPHCDDNLFFYDLCAKFAMDRDSDYDPESYAKPVASETFIYERSCVMFENVKKHHYLANGDMESILCESPSAISSSTVFKQTVLHLAADWPIGMATLLSRGGRSLVHTLDSSDLSPLDFACFNNCASVVKLLLQSDSHIDPKIVKRLEENSNWTLFQILIEELSRRRGLLKEFAEIELSEDMYRDLEIPVEHPMNDIKTVLVLSELERRSIEIPEALDYYGIDEMRENLPANFFGSSFGNTSKGADIMHCAGFLLDMHADISQEYQLRGKLRRFHKTDWPQCDQYLGQNLDMTLWRLEKGLTLSAEGIHNVFQRSNSGWSLNDGRDDLIYSYGDRIDLLSGLLSSRSGVQHTCPCCIGLCFPAVAALRTDKESPRRDIKDPEGGRFIFADLLSMVEACNSKLGPEFWAWAMPRLIHSVLYEACRLTHSLDCCKGDWGLRAEEEVKEKQEEEEYIRSRLSRLTEELTAEYEESSLLLSDFLRDRVVVRALELVDGEEEASPEDRRRLKEIGVVLEEERESDGDEIANDDRLR